MPAPIKPTVSLFKLNKQHSNQLSHQLQTEQRTHLLHKRFKRFGFKALWQSAYVVGALTISSALLPLSAVAIPTVIVNNPSEANTIPDSDNNTPVTDPQVAPLPDSPFNENIPLPSANPASGSPNALNNPNSLATNMQPSDSELSAANQELLGRNAKLQRDVNDLQTRVNVLINERSGQLFMYGAMTVIASLIVGFMLGGFFFSRRERW